MLQGPGLPVLPEHKQEDATLEETSYQDSDAKESVEKSQAEDQLQRTDDDKEGEWDTVHQALGVNWGIVRRKRGRYGDLT